MFVAPSLAALFITSLSALRKPVSRATPVIEDDPSTMPRYSKPFTSSLVETLIFEPSGVIDVAQPPRSNAPTTTSAHASRGTERFFGVITEIWIAAGKRNAGDHSAGHTYYEA